MKNIIFLTIGLFILLGLAGFSPGEAPLTKEKSGEKLLFDSVLSRNRTRSCASCHKPEFAFADKTRLRFSKKVNDIPG